MRDIEREALLQRLAAYDPDAVGTLYNLYGTCITGLFLALGYSQEVAQEKVGQTFGLACTDAAGRDRSLGRLLPWLLRIARALTTDAPQSQPVAPAKGEQAIALTEINNRLRGTQKQMLDMMLMRGAPPQQVSEKLRVPQGTIRVRFRSALEEVNQAIHNASL